MQDEPEIDAEIHEVRYDDSDVFCLDGARLLEVSTDGSVLTYRTLPDSHRRVRAFKTGTIDGPSYFTVEEPSGLRLWYGSTKTEAEGENVVAPSSRPMAPTGHAASWALAETRDRFDNGLVYEYLCVSGGNDGGCTAETYTQQHLLSQILYSSNPGRRIELVYETTAATPGGSRRRSRHIMRTPAEWP